MAAKKIKIDTGKVARRVARKVVGIVPSEKVIIPKNLRKPKHKKSGNEDLDT